MTQEWLEKVIDVGPTVNDIMARYGTEQIDAISSSEQYKIAQAALALALNEGLNRMGGATRKKRRASTPLFDELLNALPVVFMLGYDQARKEQGNAP